MNNLINIQNQNGTLTVSSREVAEHFEKEHKNVVRDIETILGGMLNFEPTCKDAIADLEVAEKSADLFIVSEYQHPQNKQWYREYLLTRDGFTLLAMGFTGSKALEWKLKYIEAFNHMEQTIKQPYQNLSPQLQLLINIEVKQKEQALALENTNKRIDDIKEVVSLDTQSWRADAKNLIVKTAHTMGGNDFIRDVQRDIFKLVDQRGGVSLETRLTNKRRRMADEGVCKSKRDKLTKVDVIADDKKLIEIYVAIVKEMAIKYGASV